MKQCGICDKRPAAADIETSAGQDFAACEQCIQIYFECKKEGRFELIGIIKGEWVA